MVGETAQRRAVRGAFADRAGRGSWKVCNEGDGFDAIAVAGFALLYNGGKERVVVEGCDSLADGEEGVVARDASEKVYNVIFFKPFLMAANV
jgi:hypothetical protein